MILVYSFYLYSLSCLDQPTLKANDVVFFLVLSVVDVNMFKARLDKFWLQQLVKFDFTADLTGTGNRSGVVIS